MITASRAQVHRRLIADSIEPARIAAGELEAYSLEQLLADTSVTSRLRTPVRRARRAQDPSGVARQWATLNSSAVELGPEATTHVAALEHAMRSETGGADNASFSAAAALRTAAAAETLQEWLDARVAQERSAAIAVERWNVWIRQVLDNLLSNAIKYTSEKGWVTVSVGRDPATMEARVTVSDTGPGIPADMRARIFDEFFRLRGHDLDLRAGAASGTGVGLAISRRLARLLGGDLTVTAATEGGAAFTLTLPPSAGGK